ncbi:MAG: NUDIX domain-containing protein [Azospirillum sp.]|nr:NUDIX domain-containing protein [Azospirillum sp.]
MDERTIISRHRTVLSPWVTVVERVVRTAGRDEVQSFHALEQADYVTVLPLAADGRILMVRQFRVAIEADSIELPGGLVEGGDDPQTAALRELQEETGYTAASLVPLGCFHPDVGRLCNRLWCYFAPDVRPMEAWQPEPGVEVVLKDKGEFLADVAEGRFLIGLHLALVGVALARGLI